MSHCLGGGDWCDLDCAEKWGIDSGFSDSGWASYCWRNGESIHVSPTVWVGA